MKNTSKVGPRTRAGLAIAGAGFVLSACGGGGGGGGNDAPLQPLALKTECAALLNMTIPAAQIGLPTSGAVVKSAAVAPVVAPFPDAEGEHLLETPARCVVQGEIASLSAGAPPIRFNINLPLANWNHRLLQSGGGGVGGALISAPGAKGSGRFDPNPVDTPYPITQGYVTFGSDGGHGPTDTAFTRNDEAMRNWAGDEIKKTRDVAVAVVSAAYSAKPQKVFFSGESAGGREAMIAAQRFHADYDGIIATSPVIAWYYVHLADNNLRDKLINGFLDPAAIKLVADRTRASCDLQDGLADGVIAKYLSCTNDAASLRCASGQPGTGCLSDAQIASVNALRDPFSMSVPLANGWDRFPGFGVTGDEDGATFQYGFYPIGTVAPSLNLPAGRGFEAGRGAVLNFAAFLVRHTIVQNDAFNPYLFRPEPYAARIQYLSSLFDATNPDLSGLSKKGGKLILVHPSADNATPLTVSAEYYRRVVARMGQAETDKVMRFYVGAGGSHNVGGTTQVDALKLLEDWTLNNVTPPDAPIAYNKNLVTKAFIRSLPACRYPAYPRYNGSGDVNLASSFTCTARPDPMVVPG
jgi:feruloyl esterase